jgi:hypothetical protein
MQQGQSLIARRTTGEYRHRAYLCSKFQNVGQWQISKIGKISLQLSSGITVDTPATVATRFPWTSPLPVITSSVINQSLFNLSAEGRKVKKQQTVP